MQASPIYEIKLTLIIELGSTRLVGKTDIAAFFMGGASIFIEHQSLKATIEPNAFQIEEQNAVNEISKLLKQRRNE